MIFRGKLHRSNSTMGKFRIKKTVIIDGSGTSTTTCIIQKKFLWWYINHGIKCYLDLPHNSNPGPYYAIYLIKRVLEFDSDEVALTWLENCRDPFYEIYKGCRIGKVSKDGRVNVYQYINYDYYRIYKGRVGYEYSYSLETLKAAIDSRAKTKQISYIK